MPAWRTAAILLLISVLMPVTIVRADEPPWKQVLKDKNLVVFNRDVEGSPIREIKAEFVVQAPTWRVCAVVCDFDKYSDFMPFTIVSKVLSNRTIDDDQAETTFFTAITPPLVTCRYYTLDIVRQKRYEGKVGWFKVAWEMSRKADLDWKNPKVRKLFPETFSAPMKVNVNRGHWILEPIDQDRHTKIHYYVHADPAGNLPPFLTNKANYVMFPKLRNAVIERVVDSRYDAYKPKQGAR